MIAFCVLRLAGHFWSIGVKRYTLVAVRNGGSAQAPSKQEYWERYPGGRVLTPRPFQTANPRSSPLISEQQAVIFSSAPISDD